MPATHTCELSANQQNFTSTIVSRASDSDLSGVSVTDDGGLSSSSVAVVVVLGARAVEDASFRSLSVTGDWTSMHAWLSSLSSGSGVVVIDGTLSMAVTSLGSPSSSPSSGTAVSAKLLSVPRSWIVALHGSIPALATYVLNVVIAEPGVAVQAWQAVEGKATSTVQASGTGRPHDHVHHHHGNDQPDRAQAPAAAGETASSAAAGVDTPSVDVAVAATGRGSSPLLTMFVTMAGVPKDQQKVRCYTQRTTVVIAARRLALRRRCLCPWRCVLMWW